MAVVLIFVFTIVFIALSVPIGISIGLSTLLAMMMTGNVGTALIAQKAFTGVDSVYSERPTHDIRWYFQAAREGRR